MYYEVVFQYMHDDAHELSKRHWHVTLRSRDPQTVYCEPQDPEYPDRNHIHRCIWNVRARELFEEDIVFEFRASPCECDKPYTH